MLSRYYALCATGLRRLDLTVTRLPGQQFDKFGVTLGDTRPRFDRHLPMLVEYGKMLVNVGQSLATLDHIHVGQHVPVLVEAWPNLGSPINLLLHKFGVTFRQCLGNCGSR